MKNKFEIFYSSRNNYNMLENEVLKNINFEGFNLINIDDQSSIDQQNYGLKLCNDNNIKYISNKNRGLQWSLDTAIDNSDSEFILWLTHDIKPITNNFFSKLNNIIEKNYELFSKQIGLSGFNLTWKPFSSNYNEKRCGVLGRSFLAKFDNNGNWYREDFINMEWENYSPISVIEAPCDMAILINTKLFKKFITPTNNYHLFLAFDDIAMQFLYNNIYNVVLTELHIEHDQQIKTGYGIPSCSAGAAKTGNDYYFGKFGTHLEFWKDRWGFSRDSKQELQSIKHHYKDTLICDFIDHTVSNGPLKRIDYNVI